MLVCTSFFLAPPSLLRCFAKRLDYDTVESERDTLDRSVKGFCVTHIHTHTHTHTTVHNV